MSTPDFASLSRIASDAVLSIEEIKRALPIAFVAQQAGIDLSVSDGKLVGLCPFHSDTRPSFDVYDGGARWGCFGCGAGGDVLDLIGRVHQTTKLTAAMDEARRLLREMPKDYTPPTVPLRADRVFDLSAAEAVVSDAQANGGSCIDTFIECKRLPFDSDWLRANFRVGSDIAASRIVAPLYSRSGDLCAYKTRSADGSTPMRTAPGSRLTEVLYGEWRDTDPSRPIILCEGESDTWVAAWHMEDRGYTVLGLPAGASAHPRCAASLTGRSVVLAFDGDDAGRAGALRWARELVSVGCRVSIVPLPDGFDLCSLSDPVPYLEGARPLLPTPDGIGTLDDIYIRPSNDVPAPLSNWIIDVDTELIGPEGARAYQGTMQPSGERVTISSYDLMGKARLVAWASAHGGAWFGSDRDAQMLLGLYQSQGPFLRPGKMATVAGMHDGHFVWPEHKIGHDDWLFVPPPNTIHLDTMMRVEPGPWATGQIAALRELHLHRVTDPILAWLALAPLRMLFRQFPILGVTGGSGTGKTTIMETLVENFTGTLITTNLTSTTPHALFSYVGATNAFPVWFDEYRPGARRSALETLQQLIRDAYTGQPSAKGGMGAGGWAEVTTIRALAPIVITGEDAFSETSHVERMVMVDLPIAGKNPNVLDDVRTWEGHGFAHAYLSWLQWAIEAGELDLSIDYSDDGLPDLPVRQRSNFALLEKGWEILNRFILHYGGRELADPDFSLPVTLAREALGHNPIVEALVYALESADTEGFVTYDPDERLIYVRVEDFVTFVDRKTRFVMPGGQEAIRRYLITHYGAERARRRFLGKQAHCLVMDADRVGYET